MTVFYWWASCYEADYYEGQVYIIFLEKENVTNILA